MALVLFHVLLGGITTVAVHDDSDRAGYFSCLEDSDKEPLVPSHRHSFLLCA